MNSDATPKTHATPASSGLLPALAAMILAGGAVEGIGEDPALRVGVANEETEALDPAVGAAIGAVDCPSISS